MQIFLFNGPPRCGKDTAGAILAKHYGAEVFAISSALKYATHALYGLVSASTPDPSYEHCKGEPHDDFFGLTPREAYIQVSERMVKPVLGNQFFGCVETRRLVAAARRGVKIAAVTGVGFAEEIDPLVDEFAGNITLVRIHRPGCTFEGDSRSYLYMSGIGLRSVSRMFMHEVDLHNDGDLVLFEQRVCALLAAGR